MNNFWPFWVIIWVLAWVVFGIIMSRIGWGRHRHWDQAPNKSAMDILKERYAKGEINKQEFEEKRRDIA
jgi:putative membrane protein